jgi:hypothetical protein
MIERALANIFKVVTEEAASNPAFGKRLEESLAKFARDHADRRLAENRVGDFHPLLEFRKTSPAEFEARLMKFDAQELRIIVEKHHLDPAQSLKGKTSKKILVAHILAAAQKRAERDAKLFEY